MNVDPETVRAVALAKWVHQMSTNGRFDATACDAMNIWRR
jgi:Fe-S-cluster formation regulator IscX/YfhJ